MTSSSDDHLLIGSPSLAKPLYGTAKQRWKAKRREERMRAKGYPEHEIRPPMTVGAFSGVSIVVADVRK